MTTKSLIQLVFISLLAACSSLTPECTASWSADDVVYIVSYGWHTELGLPIHELGPELAFVPRLFPGATTILIGYGKKTFLTAPPDNISEYILGPFPGLAVIQMVGLNVTPDQAYPPENVLRISLPPGGRQALTAYIWNDLIKNVDDQPHIASTSHDPEGLFYDARSDYSLLHTCNTWVADALQSAGLPITGDGVIFSGQVMSRIRQAAESQCRLLR